MSAANTQECIQDLIDRRIVGCLFSALPVGRPDLAKGTRTLIFDDGTGFTFTTNGSFWRESAEDIARAITVVQREWLATKRNLEGVLSLAGAPIPSETQP